MIKKKSRKIVIKVLLTLVSVSMVLGGCQGAKSVPKMEKVAQMDDDKIREKLADFTKEELIDAWGAPEYDTRKKPTKSLRHIWILPAVFRTLQEQ